MSAYVLAAANQGWWEPHTAAGTPGVGIPGGPWQYMAGGVNDRAVTGTLVDMTAAPYSVDNTGATDVGAITNSAIAAEGENTVFYFPPGTYLLETSISVSLKRNCTIRGAGPTTIFKSSPGGIGIGPSPGDPNQFYAATSVPIAKGTSTFDVGDASGYTVGQIMTLSYDNETDDTRIQAGSDLVWSSLGFPRMRRMCCTVISKTSTHITIDPPAPWDGSNVTTYLGVPPLAWWTEGWGVEDFNVQYDPDDHPGAFGGFGFAKHCWLVNVNFENFSRNASNGNDWGLGTAYRCEIRKCHFHHVDPSSSDGCIQTGFISSCLIEDNVFSGGTDITIYDSGGSINNVYRFNYSQSPFSGSDSHNAHIMLNLWEYNYTAVMQADGYHGSSSRDCFHRNCCIGYFELQIRLNRMKRCYTVLGNILGQDGVTSGTFILGEPNFNRDSEGFAGPTGTSDQEGDVPYHNYPNAIGDYTIQSSDIFAGDFWTDWKVTGELIDRVSDNEGTFTMSGGHWFVGLSATGGAALLVAAYWPGMTYGDVLPKSGGVVTAVSGSDVTIAWNPSEALPAEGTIVRFHGGPASFQELDLDVKATSDIIHNYLANSGGVGGISNPLTGGLTLAESFTGTTQPSWWNDDGFTGDYPPFDPNNQDTFTPDRLPARYRYSLVEPPSAPTFLSEVTISGEQVEGQTLTALGGLASGNPAPTYNFQWKRDGLDIVGETASTYLLVSEDIGTVISVVKTATNTEGSDTSTATTGEIQPYRGDILKITQVVNSSPITELRIINGVRSAINHSGNYPAAVDGWELVDTLTVQVPNVGHIPPIEVYSGTYIESQLP